MDCNELHFSRHAFERMFLRGINPDEVARIISCGEVIANYPDDQPFPSVLLLGFYGDVPIHAVVAHDAANGDCHLVTVYWPNPAIWNETFKQRRS